LINKKDSEYQATLYIYKQRKYKVKKKKKDKTKQTKKQAKKITKNRCAFMVWVVGSSSELSRHPFPSKQLQVPIASDEAHLPLPCIPREFSEPTAYIALATFFPLRSIQMLERKECWLRAEDPVLQHNAP